MGFSYVEGYNVAIWQRYWFIKRIQQELKKSDGQNSRAAHANNPEARAMMSRARAQVPAKLRRFT